MNNIVEKLKTLEGMAEGFQDSFQAILSSIDLDNEVDYYRLMAPQMAYAKQHKGLDVLGHYFMFDELQETLLQALALKDDILTTSKQDQEGEYAIFYLGELIQSFDFLKLSIDPQYMNEPGFKPWWLDFIQPLTMLLTPETAKEINAKLRPSFSPDRPRDIPIRSGIYDGVVIYSVKQPVYFKNYDASMPPLEGKMFDLFRKLLDNPSLKEDTITLKRFEDYSPRLSRLHGNNKLHPQDYILGNTNPTLRDYLLKKVENVVFGGRLSPVTALESSVKIDNLWYSYDSYSSIAYCWLYNAKQVYAPLNLKHQGQYKSTSLLTLYNNDDQYPDPGAVNFETGHFYGTFEQGRILTGKEQHSYYDAALIGRPHPPSFQVLIP